MLELNDNCLMKKIYIMLICFPKYSCGEALEEPCSYN